MLTATALPEIGGRESLDTAGRLPEDGRGFAVDARGDVVESVVDGLHERCASHGDERPRPVRDAVAARRLRVGEDVQVQPRIHLRRYPPPAVTCGGDTGDARGRECCGAQIRRRGGRGEPVSAHTLDLATRCRALQRPRGCAGSEEHRAVHDATATVDESAKFHTVSVARRRPCTPAEAGSCARVTRRPVRGGDEGVRRIRIPALDSDAFTRSRPNPGHISESAAERRMRQSGGCRRAARRPRVRSRRRGGRPHPGGGPS